MKRNRIYLLLIVAALSALLWQVSKTLQSSVPVKDIPGTTEASFNRKLEPIIYTKHARCRMDCRKIDEAEVKDILYNGTINYSKSDLQGNPDPKYALEGVTRDKQAVRIIFAPSKKGMVVITCIDMGEEWTCNCR
ncbi:MAG: DUF4258 domain-containing protein [Chitinophagaceae bacterium]|nr:DUF4258 domain-containing protein [Chitinophagaceae bacterium]